MTRPPVQVSLFAPALDGCADGETYEHARDHARLAHQREHVYALMADGEWRTLAEIARATRHPEASISARLRDFRKQRYGGHHVARRHVERGLFEYRLVLELAR